MTTDAVTLPALTRVRRGRHFTLLSMAKFIIKGGKKLKGEIKVQGAKNAATPCLAASLLLKGDSILENMPNITDVEEMKNILRRLGVEVRTEPNQHRVFVNTDNVTFSNLDFPEVHKMRSSILLIGPMLVRFGKVKIPHPGGCRIGVRPLAVHLKAFQALGAKVKQDDKYYYLETPRKLEGGEVVLPEFSVTATENIMMTAAKIPGKTVIKLAAAEPHVLNLAVFLKKAGAKIKGAGTHTIVIEGVSKLSGVRHEIIPDMIEAGTFIIAGLATGGEVLVKHLSYDHLDSFLERLKATDAKFQKGKDFIKTLTGSKFKAVRIQTLPYPGFPTDLEAPFSVLLTQAHGKSLIHDPMYEGRLKYLEELSRMGADIKILDPHRALIFGPNKLSGREITSFDLRAGATLILAAMAAEGESVIHRAQEVDRGYEEIEKRLQKLGADIRRIKSKVKS